jgi:hypothetical protein
VKALHRWARRLLEEEYPREWLRHLLSEHAVRAAERRKGRGETGALVVTAWTWRRVKVLHRRLLFDDGDDLTTACSPDAE